MEIKIREREDGWAVEIAEITENDALELAATFLQGELRERRAAKGEDPVAAQDRATRKAIEEKAKEEPDAADEPETHEEWKEGERRQMEGTVRSMGADLAEVPAELLIRGALEAAKSEGAETLSDALGKIYGRPFRQFNSRLYFAYRKAWKALGED